MLSPSSLLKRLQSDSQLWYQALIVSDHCSAGGDLVQVLLLVVSMILITGIKSTVMLTISWPVAAAFHTGD